VLASLRDVSSLGRVLGVGGVAVAGQDFAVGHQLPLHVAGVEDVAYEAAMAAFDAGELCHYGHHELVCIPVDGLSSM